MVRLLASGATGRLKRLVDRLPGLCLDAGFVVRVICNMNSAFGTVGLVGRRGSELVVDSVRAVAAVLRAVGADVIVDDGATAAMIDGQSQRALPLTELGASCDLVIVVGGDGSLLGVARTLAPCGVPVLGVNRGGLGFLADIAPEQIDEQLRDVLAGNYRIEDHFLLDANVVGPDGTESGDRSLALNDVVVHAGSMARMMELALFVDGEYVYEQRSDGLIIASPTGSTAYSLSAGGPIMHPSLEAVVVVPMFPHTLTSRPLVVDSASEVKVVVAGRSSPGTKVSCDSQVEFDLNRGDQVVVRRSKHSVRMLYTTDHNFFGACRSKLDWASRLGGPPSST